jgi:ligand-binding sensor domain-containing protein
MPKNRSKLRLAWLWLGWCALALLAGGGRLGAVALTDSPYTVESWSTEEGLPQSSVLAVIQTHDGYLWLGTGKGLVRFDGDQFTIFNEFTTAGLGSDQVVFLFEDSQTNLWVGTDTAGVAVIRNGQVQKVSLGPVGPGRRFAAGALSCWHLGNPAYF